MSHRPSDPVTEIVQYGQAMHDEVAAAIRIARDEGRAGDLISSETRMSDVLRSLRHRRAEINSMAPQYRAAAQVERSQINKRGRTVGHLVGRSGFGSAIRGGMERGRGNARARLAQQEADVREEIEKLKLSLADLVSQVQKEATFIKEARSDRR
ncbi:hypothetical protein [Brachybacterium fresconis]|uniref:Uncharacterized protein n=1 Tax=Brachybacterium fresconis TaxID=173363 RepID=A0ABS4YKZ7_9MICO|nr:hypothetical protein [Brachybacterium fresconis]MBP2409414.1 hypothetical protein [Brachybacterium fresconis]